MNSLTLSLLLALQPVAWPQGGVTELAKVISPSAEPSGNFGTGPIDLSGDGLAAMMKNYYAPALVFEQDQGGPGTWGLAAQLPLTGSYGDLGYVTLDGDTAIVLQRVSYSFQAYSVTSFVCQRVSGVWVEVKQLAHGLVFTPGGGSGNISLDLSGDVYALSLEDQGTGGRTLLFGRDVGGPDNWGKILDLNAGVAGSGYGVITALDGDLLAVGAPYGLDPGGVKTGAVHIFRRDQGGAGQWGEVLRLTPAAGADSDRFGSAVDLSGTTLAVYAHEEVSGVAPDGAIHVFEQDQGGSQVWGEVALVVEPDPLASVNSSFGASLALSKDLLAVGRPDANVLIGTTNMEWEAGKVLVFGRHQGAIDGWGLVAEVISSDLSTNDHLGSSVALDGDRLAAGANGEDNIGGVDAGAIYVFDLSLLSSESYCTAGTSAAGCAAALATSGLASASLASNFHLAAIGVEGGRQGLFFMGTSGRQANPWGNGTSYECVAPPVKLLGLLAQTGNTGACDGSYLQDLNALWCSTCPRPTLNPGAGALVQAQLWYRDPGSTSNQTTSLSDAVEFTVAP